MKKMFFLIFLNLFGALLFGENQINSILNDINMMNRYAKLYSANMQIASFRPNRKPILIETKILVKGLRNILLIYKKPKKDLGKIILMKDNKIWFYFPQAKQTIIMNQISTLFGSVSIGDVASPPLLDQYKFEKYKKQKTSSGELFIITFKARNNHSAYGKLVYYYQENKVIYSESYSRSGILLKKAFFSGYIKNSSGIGYATKIKIINAINPEYYSLIVVSDLKKEAQVPGYYFTPEGLKRIDE